MSEIKSNSDDLVLNSDGGTSTIKFQTNGVERGSISTTGAFTATTIDATALTGALPALSGASLTGLTSANLTGALPALDGSALTNLPAGGVDGIVSTANATAMTINSAEDIGIGVSPSTFSEGTQLQVGTANLRGLGPNNAEFGSNYYYNNDYLRVTSGSAMSHDQVNGKHIFRTSATGAADSSISWTTAMLLDSNSFMKIGTNTTPSSTPGIMVSGDGNLIFLKRASTGEVISFYQTGSKVGNIVANSSSTSYNTSSDYRLKENVIPMSGSIDRLKELKPSRFNFIADADTTVDGFLAHEAQAIVPEAVTGEKDGMMMEKYEVTPEVMDGKTVITEAVMGEREVPDMQGIDQAKLVPLLVSALQELTTEVEDLKAIVAELTV